jgi:hypothetical protein
MTSNQIVGTDFFKYKTRPMSRSIPMIQDPDLRADPVPFAEEQSGTPRGFGTALAKRDFGLIAGPGNDCRNHQVLAYTGGQSVRGF